MKRRAGAAEASSEDVRNDLDAMQALYMDINEEFQSYQKEMDEEIER